MSGQKVVPPLLAVVKTMNYKKIEEFIKAHGVKRDNTWIDYIALLFALFPKHVNSFDFSSNTIKIIKLLLQSGCRARGPKTQNFCTPLYYAVQSMQSDKKQALQIIELLLEAGASITDKSKNQETPLQLAMKNKKSRAVDLMLSKYDLKNIDVKSKDEIIHLVIACMKNSSTVVKEFVKRGVKVNGTVDPNLFETFDWPKNSTLLHIAVKHKAECVVKTLLENGANFTLLDENQQSPLHLAYYLNKDIIKGVYNSWVNEGFSRIMDLILCAHSKNVNNPIDKKGLSHFHIACMEGKTSLVKIFLKHGVDMKKLDQTDSVSDTFLNLAVRNKKQELLEILIKHGADVNKNGSNGHTPLTLAMELKNHEMAEKLLNLKANVCLQDDKGNSPIHYAFFSLPDTEKLLENMLKIHQGKMINLSNQEGLSILHIACAMGKIDIVKNLINSKVDVNACVSRKNRKAGGFTALHYAASIHKIELIKLLLKHGAKVDAANREGLTPVMIAIESPPTCKQLSAFIKIKIAERAKSLENDGDSDVSSGSVDENQVYVDLIEEEFQHLEIIKLLMKNNCSLNRVDKKGKPMLIRAYSKLVDDYDSSPFRNSSMISNEDSDERVQNACRYFFMDNLEETLYLLQDQGVDINACDQEGNCIFHYIIQSRRNSIIKDLLLVIAENFLRSHANAEVQNEEGQHPFNKAIHETDTKIIKLFLRYKVNLDIADEKDGTPLHTAALYSCNDHAEGTTHYDMIKLFLKNGANINSRDIKGRTPIFQACKWGNRGKAMKLLLEEGADVNAVDKDGRTALFSAAMHKNDTCIQILLNYGADIKVKDKYGMSVFKKLFTYITSNNIQEKHFYHVVKVLATHMRKLQLLGHRLSRHDMLYCKRLKYAYGNGSYPKDLKDMFADEKKVDLDVFDEDEKLTAEFKKELKKMKATPVDKYTSFYDILFKDLEQMKIYVENETFKNCLDNEMFPHFKDMLHMKFREGFKRCRILENAKNSFKLLTKKKLPDSCLYGIFAHLTDGDLKNLTNLKP